MGGVTRQLAGLGAVGLTLVLLPLALWVWVLSPQDVPSRPLAHQFPWPVMCSTRGCITTTAWDKHLKARRAFAAASNQEAPSQTEALTTLTRQHLVKRSFLRVPVTRQDAVRYREEILNARDDTAVQEAVGLSLDDYDTFVILPLLQQEALRQERRVESLDELFVLLASEHALVVLPFKFAWDKDAARVVEK